MDYVVMIFGIMSFMALIAFIGLVVTWIIGTKVQNATTKKVGKIGTICTALITIISFGIAYGSETIYQKQLADDRRNFVKYATDFKRDYYSATTSIEDASNEITDDWYDALGEDDMSALVAVSAASQSETSVKKNLKNLKGDIALLKVNDTGDMDMSYKDFQKAYNELYSYYSLTYNPLGESYSSYQSKTSKYDESVAKYLSEIESFTH